MPGAAYSGDIFKRTESMSFTKRILFNGKIKLWQRHVLKEALQFDLSLEEAKQEGCFFCGSDPVFITYMLISEQIVFSLVVRLVWFVFWVKRQYQDFSFRRFSETTSQLRDQLHYKASNITVWVINHPNITVSKRSIR